MHSPSSITPPKVSTHSHTVQDLTWGLELDNEAAQQ